MSTSIGRTVRVADCFLWQVKRKLSAAGSRLEHFWDLTLYHKDDITFDISDTPYVICHAACCMHVLHAHDRVAGC